MVTTNYDKYKDKIYNFWKKGYNFGVDSKTGEPMECSCDYTVDSRCHKCKFRLRGDCPTQRSEWLEAPADPAVTYPGILNKESHKLLKNYLRALNDISVEICHQDPEKGFKCGTCPYHEDYGCGYLALLDLLIDAGGVITIDREKIDSYIAKMHKELNMED